MPAPTAYTEDQLKTFLVAELADVGSVLAWTTASTPVVEALYDVELWLGVSDIVSYTSNVRTIRTLGRVAIWRQAVKSLGARYDVAEDSQSHQRSALQKQAQAALALAEADAADTGLLPGYTIGVDRVLPIHDPYQYIADEYRVVVGP